MEGFVRVPSYRCMSVDLIDAVYSTCFLAAVGVLARHNSVRARVHSGVVFAYVYFGASNGRRSLMESHRPASSLMDE